MVFQELQDREDLDSSTSNKKKYRFILDNKTYLDISHFGLLKRLYKKHKINRYDYKDSIKRLANDKRLSNKIQIKLAYLLKTVKSNTNKSTMSKLKFKEQQNKRFIGVTAYNKNRYATHLKKHVYKEITNDLRSKEYTDIMVKNIRVELNHKLWSSDK